jgi:hypothetical protein
MEIRYGWPGNVQETESGEQVGEGTATAEGVYYHTIAYEAKHRQEKKFEWIKGACGGWGATQIGQQPALLQGICMN